MQNFSLYSLSHHSVVVSRLVLHLIGPGFKSRLGRFFHWAYKLQCKIFDITILFVVLFLLFFKAVPTQSQPSIYPFFWCHIVLLFDKVANNGWFKVIKLVQNGKKIFKICSYGFKLVQLNSYLSKLVKTCSNRFKLVQKEPLYTCLGRIYLDQ